MVRIIENYTLHEIIGEGAYGKVFRAVNKLDGKMYAVKVIEVKKFRENRKLEECTVNEINILSNIEKNEHIIRYLDMLKTPNNFYFVYQFCNGGTLEALLKKQHILPEKQTLVIFQQLLQAFQVLNKFNIMHRDLKPDNIFFHEGVVKLGDFGFCKSLQKAKMTKTMLGSPIYMAPQILCGQIYSTKADIWSLGVVLYQMLYGFCPFESSTIPKLISILKENDLEFPKSNVSEDTKELMRKMLVKDPMKRIQWMELLRIKITETGKIVNNKKQRQSLVDEDDTCLEQSESSDQPIAIQQNKPQPKPVINTSIGPSFFKKKVSAPYTKMINEVNNKNHSNQSSQHNKSLQSSANSDTNFRDRISKAHLRVHRGLQICVDILKLQELNSPLYGYLMMKESQECLVKLRDQIGSLEAVHDVTMILNDEIRALSQEIEKFTCTENVSNWRNLLRKNGELKKSKKLYYMMTAYLSGLEMKQDMSNAQAYLEFRRNLNL